MNLSNALSVYWTMSFLLSQCVSYQYSTQATPQHGLYCWALPYTNRYFLLQQRIVAVSFDLLVWYPGKTCFSNHSKMIQNEYNIKKCWTPCCSTISNKGNDGNVTPDYSLTSPCRRHCAPGYIGQGMRGLDPMNLDEVDGPSDNCTGPLKLTVCPLKTCRAPKGN